MKSLSSDADFLNRLSAAQPKLSPRMASLASYVCQNYLKVAIMSTRELAEKADVSLTTVVRLPGILGYKDFDELRASIQNRVNTDLNGIDRLKNIPADDGSSFSLLQRIIAQQSDNLRSLAQTFKESDFEAFCRHLARAERVLAVGVRYTAPLADYFCYSLNKVRSGVEACTTTDSTVYDRVRLMSGGDGGDVALVVALPRYPRELVELVRYAHGCGVMVLAITDSPLSPVIPYANVTLYAKTSMQDFVGSLAAPSALLDCVVGRVGKQLGKKALQRLEALEQSANENHTYASSPLKDTQITKKSVETPGRKGVSARTTEVSQRAASAFVDAATTSNGRRA